VILESQIRALDKAIQALDRQITESRTPSVDEPFRKSWRLFTTRWQIQRDEWLQPGSTARKSFFSESRYESFKAAALKWLANYQKRIKGASAPPPKVAPVPPRPPSTSIFGNLFAGTGTAAIVTAIVIGGFFFIQNKRRN